MLSHVHLFATLWTIARQAPLSMVFSRQEYWNGLPFPPLGDLPKLGFKPGERLLISESERLQLASSGVQWSKAGLPNFCVLMPDDLRWS